MTHFIALDLNGVDRDLSMQHLTNQAGISVAGPVLKNADAYPDYREAYVIRPRTVGLSLQYSFE